LNDVRCQESQADQAADIAHSEPLTYSGLSKRARLPGADLIDVEEFGELVLPVVGNFEASSL